MATNTASSNGVYNSFSGVDINAVFGEKVIGSLQMLSYQVTREKAPVFTMGSPNYRSVARGKRVITGALVFLTFEKEELLDLYKNTEKYQPYLDAQERVYETYLDGQSPGGSFTIENFVLGSQNNTTLSTAYYSDQLMPFDVTLLATNEYGSISEMTIYDLELMNEAGGMSVDDLVLEKQYQFIARHIQPWREIRSAATARKIKTPTSSVLSEIPTALRSVISSYLSNVFSAFSPTTPAITPSVSEIQNVFRPLILQYGKDNVVQAYELEQSTILSNNPAYGPTLASIKNIINSL